MTEIAKRQVFSTPLLRTLLAIVLPVALATIGSQAVTLLFFSGTDGFYASITVLWTGIWTASFFYCFFARNINRVWFVHAVAAIISVLPFLMRSH